MTAIKPIKASDATNKYHCQYVSAIVLTADNKILLQYRPKHWRTHPDFIATFGGRMEPGETPLQALQRELTEELGAEVKANAAVSLGAVTEAITNHTELIHLFFWHDKHNTISGCYEAEAKYFDSVKQVKAHANIMDDVLWALHECQKKNY